MAAETMSVLGLGRPFQLGMLYDCRKDQLIPGMTLWDHATLQKNTDKKPQPSSDFHMITSDSIEDKSSVLDITASLKASFYSGLVEVGGSAKYLHDQKASKHQARVTLQYKATTKFTELSMDQLGMKNIQYPDVFDKGLATHVVTGILYGAQAFFVFDSEKSDSSSVQDIQGNMKAVINKIPSFKIEGQASLDISDKDKAISNTLSCKFHGDFNLKAIPTSFEEAVRVYESLPTLLGENGENAVPQKVWLMSLNNLDSKAAQIVHEISLGLVRKAQNALEDISEQEVRINDALDDQVVQHFPQFTEQLKDFKEMILDAKLNLQQNMANKLPLIRGGEENESVLDKIFEERHKSPFNSKRLSKWMDDKEREINIVRSCLDMMKGTKVVRSQNELDREVLNPALKEALCFTFTSLDSADPYLKTSLDYLASARSGSAQDDPPQWKDEHQHEDQWYYSQEVVGKMREKAKLFCDIANGMKGKEDFCFLIAAIANQNHKGASIYHFKGGFQINDDFSRPEISDVESVTTNSVLQWYCCELTLNPNTAQKNLSLSEDNRKVSCGEKEQSYPDHPDRFEMRQAVLCREGLTGRCYWEVEWRGDYVDVAVTYSEINRKGEKIDSLFGYNDKSWRLECRPGYHRVRYNDKLMNLPEATSSYPNRVGVFLDMPAGTLSFYSVSYDRLTHLYTYHNSFTGPLYPGFLFGKGSSVTLCPPLSLRTT